jgi:hypothetical protein
MVRVFLAAMAITLMAGVLSASAQGGGGCVISYFDLIFCWQIATHLLIHTGALPDTMPPLQRLARHHASQPPPP